MFHPRGPTFFELLTQVLSSTQGGYDRLAPKFDYTPFRTPDALLEPAVACLAEAEPIGSALDLCCGTGAAMHWLRPRCRERVVGVDFSAGMLAQARHNLQAAPGQAPLELRQADVLALQLRDEFDLVTIFGGLGHFLPRQQAELLGVVQRALRPAGRFAFISAPHPPLLSHEHLQARAFNAAMHLRNALWRPPFIMCYLTFLLPQAQLALERRGFSVRVTPLGSFARAKLVIATRPAAHSGVSMA